MQRNMHWQRLLFYAALCMVNACASTQDAQQFTLDDRHPHTQLILTHVPFFAQQENQCGPASLAMALSASGINVTADDLNERVYLPGKQGSLAIELIATARSYQRIAYPLQPDISNITDEILAGHPVLVFQNLGLDWWPQWHFAVAVGIDIPQQEIILHSGTHAYYRSSFDTFIRTWRRAGMWSYVITSPNELPATATASQWLHTAAQHEQLNQLDIARNAYQAALRKWPEEKLLLMALGNNAYKQGNYREAEQVYRETTSLYADFAAAHNNLAQTLYDQERYHDALQSANRAVALGGEHHEIYQQTLQSILSVIDSQP